MQKEEIRKNDSAITKLTICSMLIALLDLRNPTNAELSNYLGYTPYQTSVYLKKLKNYKYITVNKNPLDRDKRKVRISLTPLGRGQAWLARASANLVPGKDEIAILISDAIKKVLKRE